MIPIDDALVDLMSHTGTVELETMAREMASETGAPLATCRIALFSEMIRMRVAFGGLTIEQANAELAARGLPLRLRRK